MFCFLFSLPVQGGFFFFFQQEQMEVISFVGEKVLSPWRQAQYQLHLEIRMILNQPEPYFTFAFQPRSFILKSIKKNIFLTLVRIKIITFLSSYFLLIYHRETYGGKNQSLFFVLNPSLLVQTLLLQLSHSEYLGPVFYAVARRRTVPLITAYRTST